jgi:dTDP-4-dehydrorhamnose reductase
VRKVAVIGSTGMLGRQVAHTIFKNYEIIEVNRSSEPVSKKNKHVAIESSISNIESLLDFDEIDYVVNCVGLIRQKIDESKWESRKDAVSANIEIPLALVALSEKHDFKILQIGTDCVFSGRKGSYIESDPHDAKDLYGMSKSLGEVPHPNLGILRTSIVGKEENSNRSLLSWVINQPKKAILHGYSDQFWNGVTAFHFAKFVASIINGNQFENFTGVHHIVPANCVSKETLIRLIAANFGRSDLNIKSFHSGRELDMTLSTNDPKLNDSLWNLAGYSSPLSIEEMILEYSLVIRAGG